MAKAKMKFNPKYTRGSSNVGKRKKLMAEIAAIYKKYRGTKAKRKKKVAQWLYPDYHGDDVDAVVTRMDRKEALIILPLGKWIKMMKEIKDGKGQSE